MGIQINGQTDIISAIDGSLTVSGADLGNASASNLNISGIVTATEFSGNVTGNLTGTASTATAAATAYGLSGSPTLSGITSVSTTNLTVNGNAYPNAGSLSNRNLVINGAMQVAQRGTSSSSNGYVSLDRWYVNQSGGSTTFSQQTFTVGDEIEGIPTYARLTVSSSSDYTNILQRIEDVKTIPAGTVTVSFWAKGTAPNSGLKVYLVQNFGSGGSADVDISPQDVSLTATWTKHSVNFTIPSISGKTIGSSSFLQVSIGQYSNTATTAWELDITGVQLEVGTVATPFERRSYGQELALCQRYCQSFNGRIAIGNWNGSTGALVMRPLSPPMRTTPSMYSYTAGNCLVEAVNWYSVGSVVIQGETTNSSVTFQLSSITNSGQSSNANAVWGNGAAAVIQAEL